MKIAATIGILSVLIIVGIITYAYVDKVTYSNAKNVIPVAKNVDSKINNSTLEIAKTIVNVASSNYPINTKCDVLFAFSKNEWPVNPQGNQSWLSSYPYAVEKLKQLQIRQQQEISDFYKTLDSYGAGSCRSENAPASCDQQLHDLEEQQKQEIDDIVYNPSLLNELNTDPAIKGHPDVLFKKALQEPGCLTRMKNEFPNFNGTMFR